MPALAPVSKVLAFRVIGTDASDLNLGTHFTLAYSGGAPTSTQLTALAGTMGGIWNTRLAPLTDTGYSLSRTTIADLSSPTSPAVQVNWTSAGTRAGTPLPLNCCFAVRYPTNLRRRGGRWRGMWRLGVQADTTSPTSWSSTFVTSALAGVQGFISDLEANVWSGGGNLTHVGVQYYGPPNKLITEGSGRVRTVSTPLPVPAVYPIVLPYTAGHRIGSQRKRLGKQS